MPSNTRKVKCPYCDYKNTKEKVISHIDRKHEDLIPEGYTAARVLFNSIHKVEHGTCIVCKQPTEWNENTNKYKRLCNNPKCREKLREIYKTNMIKVYGKTTLLNDAEQQKKMLANRGISGTYTFQNGKMKEYTGSYEKKMLEFLDKVMGFDPDDIIMPGPTIDYIYKGESHQWITDALIVPYNLIIEVKDGGDNPNKRVMTSYREKQIAKEEMITSMGTYNYIRLTNNQFEQLIQILYELKMQMINDTEENKKAIVRVNEDVNLLQEAVLDGIHIKPLNSNEDPFEKELEKSMKTNTDNTAVQSILESSSDPILEFNFFSSREKTEFDNWCEYTDDTLRVFNFFKTCKVYYPAANDRKWINKFKNNWKIHWPDEVVEKHIGDSLDFSLLYKYFSKRHDNYGGIGFIFYLFKKDKGLGLGGHAFPCFEYRGYWYIADDTTLYKFNSEDKAWNWYCDSFRQALQKYTDDLDFECCYYDSDSRVWGIIDDLYGSNITEYNFYKRFIGKSGLPLRLDKKFYDRVINERMRSGTLFMPNDIDLDFYANSKYSEEANKLLHDMILFNLK